MPSIPNWLIGRLVTTVTMTPYKINSTGTALIVSTIPGPAQVLVGVVQEVRLTGSVTTEEISTLASDTEHLVALEEDGGLELVELLRNQFGTGLLENVAHAERTDGADYALFTFIRGSAQWAGYFLIGDFTVEHTRTQSTGRLQLSLANVTGDGNPADNPIFS